MIPSRPRATEPVSHLLLIVVALALLVAAHFQVSLGAKVPTHWGAARKFLNLYLRDISYNAFLREKYDLERIEQLLELPLDSNVSDAPHQEKEGVGLPRWRGVIHLAPDISAQYQSVAAEVAARKRISRVHLDLLYWRPAKPALPQKGKRPRA